MKPLVLFLLCCAGVVAAHGQSDQLVYDNFSDNSHGWSINTSGSSIYMINDGKYVLENTDDKDRWSALHVDLNSHSDFIISTVTTHTRGVKNVGYGILFGAKDNDNYYVFDIAPTGYYRLYSKKNGSLTYLINWTQSSAVKQNDYEDNTIKVQRYSGTWYFYVNSSQVTSYTPQEFFGDLIGFIKWGNQRIEFDNLSIYGSKNTGKYNNNSSGDDIVKSINSALGDKGNNNNNSNANSDDIVTSIHSAVDNKGNNNNNNNSNSGNDDIKKSISSVLGGKGNDNSSNSGTINFIDDFSTSKDEWGDDNDDGILKHRCYSLIADGRLILRSYKDSSIDRGMGAYLDTKKTFAISADFTRTLGETSNSVCGISLESTDGKQGYAFYISANGYYAIKELQSDGTTTGEWKESSYINKGNASNNIKIDSDGSYWSLYINGRYAGLISSHNLYHPNIFAIAKDDQRVEVDNFKITGSVNR